MQFIYHMLKMTPMGRDLSFRRAYESTAFRLQGKTRKQPWPWTTNLLFFLRMWLLVMTIPLRLRRAKAAVAIQYNDGVDRERRLYYFKKHAALDCRDDQVLSGHPDGIWDKLYFKELTLGKCWLLWRIGWMLQWAAFMGLFKPTRVNPHWKLRFAQLLLQQVLFHAPGRQQLLYFCYEPETYLSAFVAAALLPDYAPQIVSSNSVLFRDNRYLYHPRLQLRICSQFQTEEVAAYVALGWIQVASVTLWGLEEENVFDRLPRTAPTYDLGVYSSAGWARTHDLWRAADMGILRKGGYLQNPLYRQLERILEVVCPFKQSHDIRVKFYLHPHEVHLLKQHGIKPPYLDLLDTYGIDYALDGKSTIENLYEARVGLAVSSTLLFDRMHYGLRSYYYGGHEIPDFTIDNRFMGSYVQYSFTNQDELRALLEQEFGGAAGAQAT
jgi:hypothetical protein